MDGFSPRSSKGIHWSQHIYRGLSWCRMPEVSVVTQCCGCCSAAAGWCMMLCQMQHNSSRVWSKQWPGTASEVCLGSVFYEREVWVPSQLEEHCWVTFISDIRIPLLTRIPLCKIGLHLFNDNMCPSQVRFSQSCLCSINKLQRLWVLWGPIQVQNLFSWSLI